MNKEIGGYFGLEQCVCCFDNEYYKDLTALNLARNALVYIVKAKNIDKLYLPYFLCHSVSNVCDRENIKYEYYHIGLDFLPKFEKKLGKNEFLYIVNYYGQLSNEDIFEFKKRFKRIIVDNVQAFFQKPVVGVDTIYSCRKTLGVSDGAYLSTDIHLDVDKIDDSATRTKHLYGRIENGASKHYFDFKECEKSFPDLELMKMSAFTKKILNNIDYQNIIETRRANYAFLSKHLDSINLLKLSIPYVPFMYPLYVKNGFNLKQILSRDNIFIPTLWPNIEGEIEKDLSLNILPIPCDQRYNISDMKIIIKKIKELLKV